MLSGGSATEYVQMSTLHLHSLSCWNVAPIFNESYNVGNINKYLKILPSNVYRLEMITMIGWLQTNKLYLHQRFPSASVTPNVQLDLWNPLPSAVSSPYYSVNNNGLRDI